MEGGWEGFLSEGIESVERMQVFLAQSTVLNPIMPPFYHHPSI